MEFIQKQSNNEIIDEIGFKFNDLLVNKILNQRGYISVEQIQKFLHPKLEDLQNPFIFGAMQSVVDKIKNACDNKKNIMIFGDYDVDGICATAIMYKEFSKYTDVSYFLPSRTEDGYGLTIDTVQKAIDKYSPQLIITVDCGISSYNEVEFIKSKGIDVIVTDHHELPQKLPECLIINPKMTDGGFKDLCGAGVALKVVQAFLNKIDLKEYIAIAMLATIADIVSLKEDNRIIAKIGLSYVNYLPYGLQELFKRNELSNFKHITSTDIAYKIAPKLNSTGRMGDATISFKLFIEEDKTKVENLIDMIAEQNLIRQQLCILCQKDCEDILKNMYLGNKHCIVLKGNWDSGILGIVAAKLTEMYGKTTILFSQDEDILKGSCRSCDGVDIVEVLSNCKDKIIRFGGHKMAAGLTIKAKDFDEFAKNIEQTISKILMFKKCDFYAYYDSEINVNQINIALVKSLEVLEPFGCDNPIPTFKLNLNTFNFSVLGKTMKHICIKPSNYLNILGFNQFDNYYNFKYSAKLQLLVQLDLNKFLGRVSPQAIIRQTNFIGYKHNEMYDNFASECNLIYYDAKNDIDAAKFIGDSVKMYDNFDDVSYLDYGTLIVCNDKQIINKDFENFEYNFVKITAKNGKNTILYGAENYDNINVFDTVIFTYIPHNLEDIIKNNEGIKIYIPAQQKKENISTDRKVFIDYFLKIKKIIGKYKKFQNKFDLFEKIKNQYADIRYGQFIFCYNVFKELNIFEEYFENDVSCIKINNVKNDLENSVLFMSKKGD